MPCPRTDLGEVMILVHGCLFQLLVVYLSIKIWVSSPHNGSGYYGLKEAVNDTLTEEHFRAKLAGGGDTGTEYARTGYLGFMSKSDKTDSTGGLFKHTCR